jgi:hypothetical protein
MPAVREILTPNDLMVCGASLQPNSTVGYAVISLRRASSGVANMQQLPPDGTHASQETCVGTLRPIERVWPLSPTSLSYRHRPCASQTLYGWWCRFCCRFRSSPGELKLHGVSKCLLPAAGCGRNHQQAKATRLTSAFGAENSVWSLAESGRLLPIALPESGHFGGRLLPGLATGRCRPTADITEIAR